MTWWTNLFGSPPASPKPVAQQPVTKQPAIQWTPRTHAVAKYREIHKDYRLNTDAACRAHWMQHIVPMLRIFPTGSVQQHVANTLWAFLVSNFIYAPAEPLASVAHDNTNNSMPAEEETPPYATHVNYTVAESHIGIDQERMLSVMPSQIQALLNIIQKHIPQLATFEDLKECEYVPLYTFAPSTAELVQELSNFLAGSIFLNQYKHDRTLFVRSESALRYNYLRIIGKTWKEADDTMLAASNAYDRKKKELTDAAKLKAEKEYERIMEKLYKEEDDWITGTAYPKELHYKEPYIARDLLTRQRQANEQKAIDHATRDLIPPNWRFFIEPPFKLKQPRDMKSPPEELATAYLRDTGLLELLMIPVPRKPVVADPVLRFSGTWVIANQGKGKTNLLRHLIANRMRENCSIIVFDSKPELSEQLRTHQFPKETITIDPDPYLALNALDLGTHSVSTLMYLFSGLLEAKLTPLQSVLFQNALYLCTLIPNATLSTFRDIISNGAGKYPAALAQLDEEDTEFWTKSFTGATYKSTREEILWRIGKLRPSGSIFRTMFNAPKTLVKMQPLMDTNTLTIINNSRALLDPLQSEFFARLFLVMILGAAEQRSKIPESQRFPCFVIMDEAQTIISREPLLSDIIHRMRSMKIGLLCAHQSLSQLKDPLVESALDDCAIKYANNDHDAPALAQRFRTDTAHLQNLKIGQFAYWFQGQAAATTATMPWEDLSAFPTLSNEAIAQRDAEMRRRYCYTPENKPAGVIEPPDDAPSGDATWGGKPVL